MLHRLAKIGMSLAVLISLSACQFGQVPSVEQRIEISVAIEDAARAGLTEDSSVSAVRVSAYAGDTKLSSSWLEKIGSAWKGFINVHPDDYGLITFKAEAFSANGILLYYGATPVTIPQAAALSINTTAVNLFWTDFEDQSSSGFTSSGEWVFVEEDGIVYRGSSHSEFGLLVGDSPWSNGVFKTKIKIDSEQGNSRIYILGRSSSIDSGVGIEIDSSDTADHIFRFGTLSEGLFTVAEGSETINSGRSNNEWYTIRIAFNDTTITTFLDGVQLTSFSSDAATSGKAAIYSDSCPISLDELRVYEELPGSNNARLSDIILSTGILGWAFNPDGVVYSVNIENSEDSLEIQGIIEDPNASCNVLFLDNLTVGEGKAGKITVTAEDGISTKTYSFTAKRGYTYGDLGPSGVGTVVYISDNGTRGIEASPSSAIISNTTWNQSFSTASSYRGGGLSGWTIPSKDQLEQIKNDSALGAQFVSTMETWTSTQYDTNHAWYNYYTAGIDYYQKTFSGKVRPFRQFSF